MARCSGTCARSHRSTLTLPKVAPVGRRRATEAVFPRTGTRRVLQRFVRNFPQRLEYFWADHLGTRAESPEKTRTLPSLEVDRFLP
jgi:hypothetical protein